MGVNGAGKSTQMRLIAGQEEPSSGQVVRQGEPRIAYLQQEFDVDLERTVRQELFQAFGEAAEVMNRQDEVENAMASGRAAEDPEHLDQLIHELGRLQNRHIIKVEGLISIGGKCAIIMEYLNGVDLKTLINF